MDAKRLVIVFVLLVGGVIAAGCGSDDSVDRAELEARDAAEQAEELEQQLDDQESEDLRSELEALREELAQAEDGGGDTDGGDDSGGGATDVGGGTTGGGGTSGGGGTTAGLSYCTASIAVNTNTSCPFAEIVVGELIDSGGLVVDAYSPVTGLTYTMSCEDFGDALDCRGGNNARVVYIK